MAKKKPPPKPPHPPDHGHGNKWEKDTTARLIALQTDVDALQESMSILQDDLEHLRCTTAEIKSIVTENNEILKRMEDKGKLSSITARFEKRPHAA